jgi:hypothetical protein
MHASAQEGDQRHTPALPGWSAGISRKPVIHHGNDLIRARPQNPPLAHRPHPASLEARGKRSLLRH